MTADDLFDPVIAHRNRRRAAIARCLCYFSLMACPFGEGCTQESHEADSHLEHVIPPHKPGSYAETVEQLEVRWNRLHEGNDAPSAQEVSELGDVVGWLPELAADSDLDRRQWEQVQSLSGELKSLHGRLAGGSVEDADRTRWQQIISSLREFVPEADERPSQSLSIESSDVGEAAHEPTAAVSSERPEPVAREEL